MFATGPDSALAPMMSGGSDRGAQNPARAHVGTNVVHVVRARLPFILFVTLSIVAIAATCASLIPVSYSSTAEILLDQNKNRIIDLSTVVSQLPSDPTLTQNQIRVITSRNLAAHVIEQLGLSRSQQVRPREPAAIAHRQRPEESVAKPTTVGIRAIPRVEDRSVDAFLDHLSVQVLGLSTTIAITFTSSDPQTASAVANAVAEAYIERQVASNSLAARTAATWLAQRVQKLAADMQDADSAIQAYKRAHDLSEAADGTPLIDQELLAFQSQLVQARTALAEKQATRNRLRALAASGSAPNVAQIADSPVVVQLRQQEADTIRQEADLATRYGPKNPKIIALDSERKTIVEKIDGEIERIEGALDSDIAVDQAQVQTLQSSLQATEHQATVENQARVELESLEANAKSTRTAYELFVSRLREVQGQDAMQLPDASIISYAPVPDLPSSPKRSIIIVASIPAGFLLGLLLALLQARAVTTASSIPDVPEPLRVPVLARIPDAPRSGYSPLSVVNGIVQDTSSPFTRSVATLVGQVAGVRGEQAKVVGVSAPTRGEGKSVVAISLARAAACRGLRVVLIDGDPASGVAWTLRLGADIPGLSDVLSGQATLSHCIVRDALSGAMVLSNGRPNANSNVTLAPEKLAQLIGHLRRSCDLVVLDLPAVNSSRSLSQIANCTDAVILVLGWNGSPVPGTAEINAMCATFQMRNVGLVLAA
jgi:succinoglycan biosynthesis transport protein ExoP